MTTAEQLTPLMTLPKPTLKLSGLACFFFLAPADRREQGQILHRYITKKYKLLSLTFSIMQKHD